MSEPAKLEFCSNAWLALAREILGDLVVEFGPSIVGEEFAVNEIFTDPPAHLRQENPDRVCWGFRIRDAKCEARRAQFPDANMTIESDYKTALSLARMIYDGRARTGIGTSRRSPSSGATGSQPSPAMMKLLRALHNRLAVRTA